MLLARSEPMPRGYGLSYNRFESMALVVHPVPFNLIVRFFHWFYHHVRWGFGWTTREKELQEAYLEGHRKGMLSASISPHGRALMLAEMTALREQVIKELREHLTKP